MAKRRSFWINKTIDYIALGTGVGSLQICSPAQLHLFSEEPTIVRVIGRLSFSFERDSGGFKESMRSDMFLGLHCQHEDLPEQNPGSADADDDIWMWTSWMMAWSTFVEYPAMSFDSNTYQNAASQPTLSRGTHHIPNAFESVEIDARSMRKAPNPCELILGFEVNERLPETGASHKLSGYIRTLVKE